MVRWRFGIGRPARADWQTEFREVRAELDRIQGSTEAGFLAVGGRMMEIQDLAHKTAGHVEALAGLVSTGHIRNAGEMFDGLVAFAIRNGARATEAVRLVLEIGRETAAIRGPAARLSAIVRLFETLATLAQIESARVKAREGEFGSLGVEVRDLTSDVREKLLPIQEACEALEARARLTASRVEVVARRQKEELLQLAQRVQSGLEKLRLEWEAAARATEGLASQSSEIAGAVDALVSAIQFHDITRQQVEHVIEALLVVEREANRRPVPQVAALQSAQLASAGRTFASSAGRIREGLAHIGKETSEMAAAMELLLGVTNSGGQSFFAAMENDISEALRFLESLHHGDGAVQEAAAELDRGIRQTGGYVKEIEAVGFKMQRIALNASIAAARLAADGRPLETLAEAIQKLAAEASLETDQIHEKLARAGGSALAMTATPEGGEGGAAQVARLRESVHDLHATQEITFARHTKAKQDASQLAQALESARAEFGDQAAFPDGVKAAIQRLERLAARSAGGGEAKLQDLEHLYTMQAERAVHASVGTGADVAAGGEMGDNVELF